MSLVVRVVPSASKTEIIGWMSDGSLKIRLAAPPVDGKANGELVSFLAKILGVSKNEIEIVSGQTSKKKTLRVPMEKLEQLKIQKQTPLL
jgi:uncharacterized protein (TIGR00251 family)